MTVALHAQGYTNWFVGNSTDAEVAALGGTCLMGGATEHDGAMQWFLQRANGGDILVLRASGSDGYQDYFHSDLGVAVNSVETIRFDNASAATSPYVQERIRRAEAIWFAGGDQWNYVNYWRGTAIDSLINVGIEQRNIAIGGTSAGMAILGGVYFTAQNGTVTTAAALANPFASNMTVSTAPFLRVPFLASVVTDSHYDSPDRRGRHMAFMARAGADTGTPVFGIASNEYVAVCVDTNGLARVFGDWPAYEEYAYFLQPNCTTTGIPEVIQPGAPLTWSYGGLAVKACQVPGTMVGENTFDLVNWLTTDGGVWQDWSAQQGVFTAVPGASAVDCLTALAAVQEQLGRLRYDAVQQVFVLSELSGVDIVQVVDVTGRVVPAEVRVLADGAVLRVPQSSGELLLIRVLHGGSADSWKVLVP